MTDIIYPLSLALIPRVGISLFRKLKESAPLSEVFAMNHPELLALGIKSKNLREHIIQKSTWQRAERILGIAQEHNIQLTYYGQPDYPPLLAEAISAPIVLYYKGDIHALTQSPLSIVGTRMLTPYGRGIIEKWIPQLTPAHIVSGLAYGTDIEAHRIALKHGIPTSAVLASNLTTVSPKDHRPELNQMIEKGGAVLSETHLDQEIKKEFFPKRNRIIAALSPATIVIESDRNGGSVITAKQAFSFNREVFAVPGNVDQKYSLGCNTLIREQIAAPLIEIEQLTPYMSKPSIPKVEKQIQLDFLTPIQQQIMSLFVQSSTLNVQTILEATALSVQQLNAELTMLELQKLIQSLPGKMYKRI